jgi:hypothetical protein
MNSQKERRWRRFYGNDSFRATGPAWLRFPLGRLAAMKSLWLLLLLPLVGCTTALHNKSDLYYGAYLPRQLGGKFSYTGSTSTDHYFYKKRWWQFDRRFTLPAAELQFQCVMPKTSDRSLWREVRVKLSGDRLEFYRRDNEVGGYGVYEEIDFDIEQRSINGVEFLGR